MGGHEVVNRVTDDPREHAEEGEHAVRAPEVSQDLGGGVGALVDPLIGTAEIAHVNDRLKTGLRLGVALEHLPRGLALEWSEAQAPASIGIEQPSHRGVAKNADAVE
jgi:hypothetical protein